MPDPEYAKKDFRKGAIMTKSEYMNALREKLQHYNRALEMEILEDYEQHFA